MRRLWKRLLNSQGSVAVETAMAVPFLMGAALLAVDMHTVGMQRTRLEEGAGSIALNVATQKKLTASSLDALIESALQQNARDTEVILLNVKDTGVVSWLLQKGDGANLCEIDVDGVYYTGTLPQDPPENEDAGNQETEGGEATSSMVVVKVCRRTSGLKERAGIKLPGVMEVQSIYRAGALEIQLDDELADENLVDDGSEDEEDEA